MKTLAVLFVRDCEKVERGEKAETGIRLFCRLKHSELLSKLARQLRWFSAAIFILL